MAISRAASGWRRALATAALATLALAPPAAAETVLKAALHSDLKIIDPVWTTALISTHHGMMVYDTLFALDRNLQVKPQMVDTWTVSDDKLTWTFTLRDGLEWHDGAPVTAEDCIASLKRWSARDGMGQKLMSFVASLEPSGRQDLRHEAQGALRPGAEHARQADLQRALHDAQAHRRDRPQQADHRPHRLRPLHLQGRRNGSPARRRSTSRTPSTSRAPSRRRALPAARSPRSTASSGSGSGTRRPPSTRCINGEIDFIEAPPHDLLPLVANDANIELLVIAPMGRQYAFRFNVLHKPFDNAKVRQAVAYALNQKDFLDATIGNPKYYVTCKSIYPCGSPLRDHQGLGRQDRQRHRQGQGAADRGRLRRHPRRAHAVDRHPLARQPRAGRQVADGEGRHQGRPAGHGLADAGVAPRQEGPAGRAAAGTRFLTSWGSVDVLDPVSTNFLNAACEKATFGWPCDAELEKLRDAFAKETDPAKQKAIAEQVAQRAAEYPTHVVLGQYLQPSAFRKNVTGVIVATNVVFWNIEKK